MGPGRAIGGQPCGGQTPGPGPMVYMVWVPWVARYAFTGQIITAMVRTASMLTANSLDMPNSLLVSLTNYIIQY
jgi:hypothetical protein